MTLIEKELRAAFQREPGMSHNDDRIRDLFSELREATKSPSAQMALGCLAMSMITSRLKADIRTAKAIGNASGWQGD